MNNFTDHCCSECFLLFCLFLKRYMITISSTVTMFVVVVIVTEIFSLSLLSIYRSTNRIFFTPNYHLVDVLSKINASVNDACG